MWNVLGFDAGRELASVLKAELPDRFRPQAQMPRAEDYAVGLLRAVVADATIRRMRQFDEAPAVIDHVEEMLRLVVAPDQTIRSIQLLTDIDVSGVAGSVISEIRLEPVRDLQQTLSRELKEAASAITRIHVPLVSHAPRALAIADSSGSKDAWLLAMEVRPTLLYLTTSLRLLTGATIVQSAEVYGQPTTVHASGAMATEPEQESGTYWRRVGTLRPEDLRGIGRLVAFLKEVDLPPAKGGPSLAVAIGRYNRAHRAALWQDQVVDLAIGIEAALSAPGEREDLTLALRSRATHLLASPRDPVSAIFEHVGDLYKLRGRVVHGEIIPESFWTRLFKRRGINQVLPGDRLAVLVDRWRDLLRRAILVRLLLSGDGESNRGPWPLRGGEGIDGQLVHAAGRHTWRVVVRRRAAELGISRALLPAEPLRDLLHDPWSDDLSN